MRLYIRLLQNTDSIIYNEYKNVAVTATCKQCADEGIRVLREGGSAIDCAITTLLCAGVRNPERLGIGGGFVACIYSKSEQRVRVLMARETAPDTAKPNIFKTKKETIFGGKAVAVPGALRGYWELHQRYGRLPWRRLFEPAIAMCRDGVYVQPFTHFGLKQVETDIYKSNCFHILVDPFTGKVKTAKHKIFRPKLAHTLEKVALVGPDALYNGVLTANFVKDIKEAGGIITMEDLAKYRVRWAEPLQITVKGLKIYSPPPPASGAVLLCALNIMNRIANLTTISEDERWHYVVEIWKYCYGFRSQLGDPFFVPEVNPLVEKMLSTDTADCILQKINKHRTNNNFRFYGGKFEITEDKGTAHFNIISENGDAISITDSINTLFGAMFLSEETGIILNNTLNDFAIPGITNVFSVPVSAANILEPGKTPLTSMVPTIILDSTNGHVRLLIGAAGGTRIISAVSVALLRHILLGEDLQKAVQAPRLHHQLLPMCLEHENDFPEEIVHQLWIRGHQPKRMIRNAVVGIISKPHPKGILYAMGDYRRHCANSGY